MMTLYKLSGERDGVERQESDGILWIGHTFLLKIQVPIINHSWAYELGTEEGDMIKNNKDSSESVKMNNLLDFIFLEAAS